MNKEALKNILAEIFPNTIPDETGEWINMSLDATNWAAQSSLLKNDPRLDFDFLFSLTCIDWKTHLTMVYHLTSTKHREPLVIKIQLNRERPEIETVSQTWRTAEFHEREVYELFGVHFLHHPDLRLLILPDGWEGKNPLRKDYEDAVNMIRL